MEYKLYFDAVDEDPLIDIATDINEAKEAFGKRYDEAVDAFGDLIANEMLVIVNVNKGKAGKVKFAEYSIKDFLNLEKIPIGVPKEMKKGNKYTPMTTELYNKLSDPENLEEDLPDWQDNKEDSRVFEERAKAFSDDEYRTVLKYVPTGFILGELMRRFDEYNKATDGIASLLDNMKIYNKE